jgi:hypothetical protein
MSRVAGLTIFRNTTIQFVITDEQCTVSGSTAGHAEENILRRPASGDRLPRAEPLGFAGGGPHLCTTARWLMVVTTPL